MASDLKPLYERLEVCDQMIDEFTEILKEQLSIAVEERICIGVHGPELQARIIQDLPLRISMQSGMLLNELRSNLDSLAFTLAEREGEFNASQVAFPIASSEGEFPALSKKRLGMLSSTDQEMIALQAPYRNGDQILWNLHDLDRKRKHWRLTRNEIAIGMTLPNGLLWGYRCRAISGHEMDVSEYQWVAQCPYDDLPFFPLYSLVYFPEFHRVKTEYGEESQSVDLFLRNAARRVREIISLFN